MTIDDGIPSKPKPPRASLNYVDVDREFCNGVWFHKWDIVSIVYDGVKFYAQIKSFARDQFGGKGVFICWLFPHRGRYSPRIFDPNNYVLGFTERFPVDLNLFRFELPAPDDRYWRCPLLLRLPNLQPPEGFVRRANHSDPEYTDSSDEEE